jgi:pectinesterase
MRRHALSAWGISALGLVAIVACSGGSTTPAPASGVEAGADVRGADGGSRPGADGAAYAADSTTNDAGVLGADAPSGDGAVADVADAARSGDVAIPVGCSAAARPQLSDSDAAMETVLAFLAQAGSLAVAGGLVTDHWDPTTGLGDVSSFTPAFTVAVSGGTHTTVQGAIDAAVARGGTSRLYVLVTPGTYREVVCVPAGAPPITLYGSNADASQTVIVFDHYNGEPADSGVPGNPCSPPGASTFGTNASATFAAFANGFQAKNMTFSNDVTPAMLGATTGTQAVALYTQADQIVLDHVRVLGHQDSLYLESPSSNAVVRAYVKDSYVAGDVDFIFGGATMVLDGCQIQSVSDRRAPTTVLSPSTDSRNPFGLLAVGCQFTADANTAAGSVDLGRAWDRSCVDVPTYVSSCVAAGHYPNGQGVVRDSVLGAQVAASPWAASATTRRPFCSAAWTCLGDGGACPANRLYEYKNTGPGAAP